MKISVQKLIATGLMAAGLCSALPSASFAQDLEVYIGRGDRDGEQNYDRPRGCSERQAIRRAYRLGMRDLAIQSVNRRQILIDGIGRHGEYTTLALANRSGCPRIG